MSDPVWVAAGRKKGEVLGVARDTERSKKNVPF